VHSSKILVEPMPLMELQFLGRIITNWSEGGGIGEDIRRMFRGLNSWTYFNLERNEEVGDSENRVREIMELLGYRGIAPKGFLELLQRPETRWKVLGYLFTTVAINRVSLDRDPQSSLLPFLPDVHRDMKAYVNALRRVQCKPLKLFSVSSTFN
jgi:hypothetical protein